MKRFSITKVDAGWDTPQFAYQGIGFAYWNGELYITNGHHPDIVDYLTDSSSFMENWERLEADEMSGKLLFGWIYNNGEIQFTSGNFPDQTGSFVSDDLKEQAKQAIKAEYGGSWEGTKGNVVKVGQIDRIANIFDPIEDKLDQRVFNDEDPRNSIKNFVKRLYYREFAREFPNLDPKELVKLYITGSLTTFQYSDTSDMDISVFPDYSAFEKAGIDPKEARKRLISMSIDHIDGTFLPGGSHPLQFFVVPEGIKPTDLYQFGLRSAYDLGQNEWIIPPEKSRVKDIKREMPEMYQRASAMADKMTQALDDDPETARAMWLQVHQKRQLDQRAGLGDFSEGNIVYKFLLNQGLFDRIRTELNEYIANVIAMRTKTDTITDIPAPLNALNVLKPTLNGVV